MGDRATTRSTATRASIRASATWETPCATARPRALAHEAAAVERPVHQDDLRLQLFPCHRTEVARIGRAVREVTFDPVLVLAELAAADHAAGHADESFHDLVPRPLRVLDHHDVVTMEAFRRDDQCAVTG